MLQLGFLGSRSPRVLDRKEGGVVFVVAGSVLQGSGDEALARGQWPRSHFHPNPLGTGPSVNPTPRRSKAAVTEVHFLQPSEVSVSQ